MADTTTLLVDVSEEYPDIKFGDASGLSINDSENDVRLKSLVVRENGNVQVEESTRLTSSSWQQNNSGYGSATPSPSPSPERDVADSDAVRCGCHVKTNEEDKRNRTARIKLVVACIIALVFVVGEVTG